MNVVTKKISQKSPLAVDPIDQQNLEKPLISASQTEILLGSKTKMGNEVPLNLPYGQTKVKNPSLDRPGSTIEPENQQALSNRQAFIKKSESFDAPEKLLPGIDKRTSIVTLDAKSSTNQKEQSLAERKVTPGLSASNIEDSLPNVAQDDVEQTNVQSLQERIRENSETCEIPAGSDLVTDSLELKKIQTMSENGDMEEILSQWRDPSKIDSCCRNTLDVIGSISIVAGQAALSFFRFLCCLPRDCMPGDGVRSLNFKTDLPIFRSKMNEFGMVIKTSDGLEISPEPSDVLHDLYRIVSNQYSFLCPSKTRTIWRISQPLKTDNFVVSPDEPRKKLILGRMDPISDEHEMSELKMRLPENFPCQDKRIRYNVNCNLAAASEWLGAFGFRAYKDSMLILKPEAHVCIALFYDEKSEKIFVHFRDTATNDFWEKNCGKSNWRANFAQGVGLVPKAYAEADRFVYALKSALEPLLGEYEDLPLELVGYSMGGGLAFFTAARNLIPATGINPAALALCFHSRFFAKGWEEFMSKNTRVIASSGDLLSQKVDNPETGGLLPTKMTKNTKVFVIPTETIDHELAAARCCGGLKKAEHAHYLPPMKIALLYLILKEYEKFYEEEDFMEDDYVWDSIEYEEMEMFLSNYAGRISDEMRQEILRRGADKIFSCRQLPEQVFQKGQFDDRLPSAVGPAEGEVEMTTIDYHSSDFSTARSKSDRNGVVNGTNDASVSQKGSLELINDYA